MRDERRYRRSLAQLFALLGAWAFVLGYVLLGILRGMSLWALSVRLPVLFGVVYALLFAYFFWIMRQGIPQDKTGESS
ncbi:hypothetical protein [Candidatus Caldatribacterium saccharofermentans]|uniref:Uncharacterized protein n=1 Tax=Candidatus Caldatribacterium saccharofermentans TaxID=1454753 RepID=A0A7V4TK44_9BACT